MSQCGEDIFLNDHIFKNKKNGFYIELGALDGVLYSNTKFFEENHGWSGILIEPHPDMFQQLMINRPHNSLFNSLVSCNKEPLQYKYFVNDYAAVSGVENTLLERNIEEFYNKLSFLPQNTITIKPISLTSIVKSTGIKNIDFLSLDVEGHEYEVLQSWDFSIPIHVILIEVLEKNEKNELCKQILLQHNYSFYSICAHNEVYILNTSYYK